MFVSVIIIKQKNEKMEELFGIEGIMENKTYIIYCDESA